MNCVTYEENTGELSCRIELALMRLLLGRAEDLLQDYIQRIEYLDPMSTMGYGRALCRDINRAVGKTDDA